MLHCWTMTAVRCGINPWHQSLYANDCLTTAYPNPTPPIPTYTPVRAVFMLDKHAMPPTQPNPDANAMVGVNEAPPMPMALAPKKPAPNTPNGAK